MALKPIIELRADTANGRGSKLIYVDGALWGYAVNVSRGMHGNRLEIQNISHTVLDNVWSDKRYLRELLDSNGRAYGHRWKEHAIRDGRYEPLEARVVNTIRTLIAKGKLESPAVIRQRAKASAERHRAALEKQAEANRAAFDDRARQVLKNIMGDNPSEDEVAEVVAAMKWAQTQ